jgi:hypothetical protein
MTGDEQPMYKLCFALIFLLAREVAAPAVSVLPPMTIFENDQVRVIRTLEKPHVKGKFHEHQMNRVMIYLQLGKQRFEYQDGRKPVISEYEAGQVSWSAAEGMHSPECLTDEPFNIVEVELKRPGTGKKIASSLDPLKIDPKDYKLEFENDQVRVFRNRIGPNGTVPMHEHTLNRVNVFLTDQNVRSTEPNGKTAIAQHKAGEAIWSSPVTHMEQNLNDRPFEVITVEIKE